jgi:hypothetical protein
MKFFIQHPHLLTNMMAGVINADFVSLIGEYGGIERWLPPNGFFFGLF